MKFFCLRLARSQVRISPNTCMRFLHDNTQGLPPFGLSLQLQIEVSNPCGVVSQG